MQGHDIKEKYAAAEASFVASYGKTPISKLGDKAILLKDSCDCVAEVT